MAVSYFEEAWDEMLELVKATWPDVQQIARADQTKRFNWGDKVALAELGDPFALAQFGPAIEHEGGGICNEVYRFPVTIYRARGSLRSVGEKADSTSVFDDLMGKGRDLANALFTHADASATAKFQLMERPAVDAGDANPANAQILETQSPFWTVAVAFDAMVGITDEEE